MWSGPWGAETSSAEMSVSKVSHVLEAVGLQGFLPAEKALRLLPGASLGSSSSDVGPLLLTLCRKGLLLLGPPRTGCH